jgi:3-oxoadipate enol-lactonase
MPTASIRDIEIYYERSGEGPPLLFIGGSGGDLRRKPGVFEGPLPRSFDVLAFDQHGLGRSSRPERAYSMADYGEDVAGLLDAIGWTRCHVVGVSFGGMVAQEFATRYPDRVERLVLACTSSGGKGGASYPLHELEALPEAERTLRSLELADLRCDRAWREANPEATERLVEFRNAGEEAGRGEPGRAEGLRRQLEARSGHDTWDRLPRLEMPVLVCGGRHDGIAPLANQQALTSQLPKARLEIFEGGHLFLVQDRAAFPRIIEFLLE